MNGWIDALVVLLVLLNLKLLGSARLMASIRTVAMQGILLGVLPLVMHAHELLAAFDAQSLRMVITAAASLVLKGLVFPALLLRASRGANVNRELQPFVGYALSIMGGVAMLGGSLWIASRLPAPGNQGLLPVSVALFTILVGLFVIVSRKTAISQVLGYLAMENGIYGFGMCFANEQPLLIELGILLDVFMAVFVMGITIYHINREFDHIDTERLTQLKD